MTNIIKDDVAFAQARDGCGMASPECTKLESAQRAVHEARGELEMMVVDAVDKASDAWIKKWGQIPVEIRARSWPVIPYGGNPRHMQCRAEVALKSDPVKAL